MQLSKSSVCFSALSAFICGASALRACLDPLPINGLGFPLSAGFRNGAYIECAYSHAFASPQFCFYNATTFGLTHAPNVPPVNETIIPPDSNAACPTTLPSAGSYRLVYPQLTADNQLKCITMSAASNGAPVVIQTCDFTGGTLTKNQIWTFTDANIHIGNMCLDVTGGSDINGVRLQVWACATANSNSNQQFTHNSGGNVLIQPADIIHWNRDSSKCLDLVDGSLEDGNGIQLWACTSGNTNQLWSITLPQ